MTNAINTPIASAHESTHTPLLNGIVNDPVTHPERTNATLARIQEIIQTLASPFCGSLLTACIRAAGPDVDFFEPIPTAVGEDVARALAEGLGPKLSAQAAQMLRESELSTQEVIHFHRKHKIPVSHLEDDLLPVRGQGAKIWDSKGRVYIDLDSNYSATNLGNANEAIATGLFNQAKLLISQKEDRIQVARTRFLKEIGGMLPDGLEHFYWQNSGGEAVDKALKIAKAYTGHTGVIAFEGGFHGRTHGAVSVTHNLLYRKPFGLHDQPWVYFAPYDDLTAVAALLEKEVAKTVILEWVQGEEAGVRAATPEFSQGLRELCDQFGAVLIADEVQTGFGRVAGAPGQWFASQRLGVMPDLMTIGKSFGGGYPVTAVVTNAKVAEAMQPGYDGSTFGGNPMAMTAALIATRQMKALDLTPYVVERAEQFANGLSKIDSPLLLNTRTVGLMIGIDLPSSEHVHNVQGVMKEHGAHSSLSTGATLRWLPLLVITAEEVQQVLQAFTAALNSLEGA